MPGVDSRLLDTELGESKAETSNQQIPSSHSGRGTRFSILSRPAAFWSVTQNSVQEGEEGGGSVSYHTSCQGSSERSPTSPWREMLAQTEPRRRPMRLTFRRRLLGRQVRLMMKFFFSFHAFWLLQWHRTDLLPMLWEFRKMHLFRRAENWSIQCVRYIDYFTKKIDVTGASPIRRSSVKVY